MSAVKISEPTAAEPGAFVGDFWFGHPVRRNLATHRWDGDHWLALALPDPRIPVEETPKLESALIKAAKRHAPEIPSMEDHIFQWFNGKDPEEMQKCLEAYRAANLPDLTFDAEGEVE